jgi:hypothetical protein
MTSVGGKPGSHLDAETSPRLFDNWLEPHETEGGVEEFVEELTHGGTRRGARAPA